MGTVKLPYPPEFRQEAVRLAQTSGTSRRQIAADLDISTETLRLWLRQAEHDAGERDDGLTTTERDELRRLRRENQILWEEREILKKSRGLLRQGDRRAPLVAFAFVEREKAQHAVVRLCRVLGVSPSGYDAWRRRTPSARARQDAVLRARIRISHRASRQTDGAPRIHADLRAAGVRCGRKRVARLMRTAVLVGCHRRRAVRTTQRAHPVVPERIQRRFVAAAPNQLWPADIA